MNKTAKKLKMRRGLLDAFFFYGNTKSQTEVKTKRLLDKKTI